MEHLYGTALEPGLWNPLRSVVGGVKSTIAGNVALRVGREVGEYQEVGIKVAGWETKEYVVLDSEEAVSLGVEVLRAAPVAARIDLYYRARAAAEQNGIQSDLVQIKCLVDAAIG